LLAFLYFFDKCFFASFYPILLPALP